MNEQSLIILEDLASRRGLQEASPWLTPSRLCWISILLYTLWCFSCKPASSAPPQNLRLWQVIHTPISAEVLLHTSLKEQRTSEPRTPHATCLLTYLSSFPASRPGHNKKWPRSQIPPPPCFCMAHQLTVVFSHFK